VGHIVPVTLPMNVSKKLIETGACTSIREVADAEKITPSHVSRALTITLLAPDLVEAILDIALLPLARRAAIIT